MRKNYGIGKFYGISKVNGERRTSIHRDYWNQGDPVRKHDWPPFQPTLGKSSRYYRRALQKIQPKGMSHKKTRVPHPFELLATISISFWLSFLGTDLVSSIPILLVLLFTGQRRHTGAKNATENPGIWIQCPPIFRIQASAQIEGYASIVTNCSPRHWNRAP